MIVPDPASMNLPGDLQDGKAGPHTGLWETEAQEAGTWDTEVWMWWSAVGGGGLRGGCRWGQGRGGASSLIP